jgi:hypothetical protein
MNPLAALLAAEPDQVILTVRNGEIFISFVEARVPSARALADREIAEQWLKPLDRAPDDRAKSHSPGADRIGGR